MKVLCVAEKPSIARSITAILSDGQFGSRNTRNRFIKNYDFNYPQMRAQFTVTAVSGHLMSHDFEDRYRAWHSCDPFVLFEAPVIAKVPQESKSIEDNLGIEARQADMLMIWTDCDREGENIGAEVAKICRRAKRNIIVKRARFSAIIPQQIHNAAQHSVELDQAQADAVEARIILDLRLGAAFTRMQTLRLQSEFAVINDGGIVSYGPCQFPTLGFVVARFEQARAFVPETFWYITLALTRENVDGNGRREQCQTDFKWRRNHLFDFDVAATIYEMVLEDEFARVTKKTTKATKKWKPLPLTTVELQKAGSRLLKLAPKKVLDVAEKLYQQGFLSYPRTETDQYDPEFDFMSLIGKQTGDASWGAFAATLQNGGFNAPRRGKNNDKAHPPIHPTNYAGNLNGDEKRVYDFVTRRFLASCSKDAEGEETTVEVIYGDEYFSATGLVVLARNYLDVYVYDKWQGKFLPNFEEGEQFRPSVCELKEGQTTKPPYLTEADLVGLMDKNGIGTDATIAQHIQTIVDRGYVLERIEGTTKFLVPSTLGIGLIEGYNAIGFDRSLSKPQLRRETERRMVEVCERTKSKNDMLVQSIEQYKEVFVRARGEFQKIVDSVGRHINGGNEDHVDGNDQGDGGRGARGGRGGRGGGRGGRGGRGGGGGGGGRRNNDDDDDDDDDYDDSNGGGGGQNGGANTRVVSKPRSTRNTTASSRLPPPPPPSAAVTDIEMDEPTLVARPTPSMSSSAPRPPPSRSKTAPASSMAMVVGVQCHCKIPAGESIFTKEGPNNGRRHWNCSADVSCGFFEWMDGPSSGTAARDIVKPQEAVTKIASQRSWSENIAPIKRSNEPERRCECEMTAILLTVNKEGANQGRKFWRCPNGTEKGRCRFFEWDDEPPSSKGPRATPSSQSQNDGGKSGDCFKCGQSGHWASSCPNAGSQGTKRSASFGTSANNGTSSGSCFKCGEEGHYSNACPNGPAKKPRSMAPSSSSVGACFKCGIEGHFSNACTGSGGGRSQGGASSGACFKCGEEGHFSNACPGGGTRSGYKTRGTGAKRGRGRSASGTSSTRGGSKRGKAKSRFAAADGI